MQGVRPRAVAGHEDTTAGRGRTSRGLPGSRGSGAPRAGIPVKVAGSKNNCAALFGRRRQERSMRGRAHAQLGQCARQGQVAAGLPLARGQVPAFDEVGVRPADHQLVQPGRHADLTRARHRDRPRHLCLVDVEDRNLPPGPQEQQQRPPPPTATSVIVPGRLVPSGRRVAAPSARGPLPSRAAGGGAHRVAGRPGRGSTGSVVPGRFAARGGWSPSLRAERAIRRPAPSTSTPSGRRAGCDRVRACAGDGAGGLGGPRTDAEDLLHRVQRSVRPHRLSSTWKPLRQPGHANWTAMSHLPWRNPFTPPRLTRTRRHPP